MQGHYNVQNSPKAAEKFNRMLYLEVLYSKYLSSYASFNTGLSADLSVITTD